MAELQVLAPHQCAPQNVHRPRGTFLPPKPFIASSCPPQHPPQKATRQVLQTYAAPLQVRQNKMTNKETAALRRNAYAHHSAYGNSGAMLGAAQPHLLRGNPYVQAGATMHGMDSNITALANGFGAMNLRASSYGSNTTAGTQNSGVSSEYNGHHGQPFYMPGQQMVYHPGHIMPAMGQANGMHHPGMYNQGNHFGHPQHNFPGHGFGHHVHDNSPLSANWTPRVPSGDMPTLITPRRDSNSSNEAENLPGTPFNGYGHFTNGVTVVDRSPSAVYGSTPSPSQLAAGYGMPAHAGKAQSAPVSLEMQILLQRDPPIPRAIPAPNSPIKPLDRSLENKTGETNVYIRGLMPETTDDILHAWGARFGDIASSKAIIDMKTNLCKGFGFVKYHNFDDAEHCIRGFHHLGYEVSFARESFYSKLKKFADEHNTNLYVSNIPRNMNEHDLSGIFAPNKVMSARILRDTNGNGRGVGFARFESRDVCEDIIKMYNNKTITKGDDEYTIQIRYADTHEQKALKQQTAAARQYRAAEFEYGVMQVRGMLASPVTAIAPMGFVSGVEQRSKPLSNEFESHLKQDMSHAVRHPSSALRFSQQSSNLKSGGVAITPISVATTPKIEDAVVKTETDTESPSSAPVIANGDSTADNASDHD